MPLKPLVSVGGQGQLLVLGVKSSRGFTPKSRFLGILFLGGEITRASCSVVHMLGFNSPLSRVDF